ncbi:DUF4349 domain-containing protein [Salibacterium aidingense]|uniref:DUF4349 domain-containing protein n=1 Tax=Salibacterium aidingense TaxID=384933 RepID=UPI0005558F9C|nr:DUF4349 domain-containing protein [Salibacterium aidingense]
MWKWMMTVPAVILLILAAACNNEESQEAQQDQASTEEAANDAGTAEQSAQDSSGQAGGSSADTGENTEAAEDIDASDRMVIKTGNLSIEVENFHEAEQRIETQVEDTGGYIVESDMQVSAGGERSGSLSVRIPQENFSPFMNGLESDSIRVQERSTQGEDVTEEYVDLESRLSSKETQEERLTSFMEEAGNTDALLQISEDLSAVQEEIEQLKGQMNYLENHVAYSTVDIQIQESTGSTLQSGESLNTWEKAQNLFTRTLNGIVRAASGIAVFLIGLSPVLVPLLLLAAGSAFFYRKRKRNEE